MDRSKLVWSLALLALLATSVAGAQPAGATFPGANGKIAFVRFTQNPSQIFVVNPDGSGEAQVTVRGGSEPAWSPDGTKIAFNAARDGVDLDVYVINADGSNEVQLTFNDFNDFHPEFAYDGRIVFVSDRPNDLVDVDREIYVMNADGTGVVQVTHNAVATDMLPAPAPNEDRVAFTSDLDGDQDIYVIRLDGSDLQQVTNHPAIDALPSWSPKGNKLAFISERDYWPATLPEAAPPDDGELYTVRTSGASLTRVTNTPERSEIVPAWSPDGTKIAVSGCQVLVFPSQCSIVAMNPDGTGEVDVVADGAQPDWQRVAPTKP